MTSAASLWFKSNILSIERETPSVKSFWLSVDEAFSFNAGQYILVRSPIETREEAGYSICSSPNQKGRIQIAVKDRVQSPMSQYLHLDAKVGDRIEICGPNGDFYFREGMSKRLIVIAGGIGITPLMSMVRYARDERLDIETVLVYSVKTPVDIVFRKELDDLQRGHGKFKCVITTTAKGAEGWKGLTRRVDSNTLKPLMKEGSLYCICGPPLMVEAVSAILKSLGVEQTRVKTEAW